MNNECYENMTKVKIMGNYFTQEHSKAKGISMVPLGTPWKYHREDPAL